MNRRIAALAVFAAAASAHAILPGTTTTAWPWVGKLGGSSAFNSSAVAIQDHWILTAAHTVAGYSQDGARFQMDGGPSLASVEIVWHPTDDLALIRVNESMPGWYDLHWAPPTGSIGTLVGYGVSGTWNGSSWTAGAYPATYGTKREGRNRMTGWQYIDFGDLRGNFFYYDFDSASIDFAGDGTATTNEATLGGGDSGGATMLQDAGIWKVAGIHSWVGSFSGGPAYPQYGSAFGDVRVASYRTWIEGIVPAEVGAATMTPGPGAVVSGTVANVLRPDDVRMLFRPGAILVTTADPLVIVAEGTSPVAATTRMAFCLESSATIANLVQKVELYNFTNTAYELVDTRTLGTADGLVEIVNTANPSSFIGPGNLVRARIKCKPNGALLVFPWNLRIDRAVWNIKR